MKHKLYVSYKATTSNEINKDLIIIEKEELTEEKVKEIVKKRVRIPP